jgi:hypothetical protein
MDAALDRLDRLERAYYVSRIGIGAEKLEGADRWS